MKAGQRLAISELPDRARGFDHASLEGREEIGQRSDAACLPQLGGGDGADARVNVAKALAERVLHARIADSSQRLQSFSAHCIATMAREL